MYTLIYQGLLTDRAYAIMASMKKYLLVKHLCEIAPSGGKARAKSLSKERRMEIALKANNARWNKSRLSKLSKIMKKIMKHPEILSDPTPKDTK